MCIRIVGVYQINKSLYLCFACFNLTSVFFHLFREFIAVRMLCNYRPDFCTLRIFLHLCMTSGSMLQVFHVLVCGAWCKRIVRRCRSAWVKYWDGLSWRWRWHWVITARCYDVWAGSPLCNSICFTGFHLSSGACLGWLYWLKWKIGLLGHRFIRYGATKINWNAKRWCRWGWWWAPASVERYLSTATATATTWQFTRATFQSAPTLPRCLWWRWWWLRWRLCGC